jgi:hypothetical protein
MAAHEPQTVAAILLDIPDTDNPFIVRNFLEAAMNMPPETAGRLATKIANLIKSPFLVRGDLAGALAVHLARGGEHAAALTVLRSVLEVIPDPRPIPQELKSFAPDYKYEARARIRDYEYELLLQRHALELTDSLGIPFVQLLSDLLDKALKLELRSKPDTGNIEDYSYIWRPHITTGERSDSIKNLLGTAVLSSAHRLCVSAAHCADVRIVLGAKRFKLFRRIELELLARHADLDPTAAANKLLDQALFDDVGVRPEYYALAQRSFGSLELPQQNEILGWIEKGLDAKLLQERAGLSADDAQNRIDYWRLERLAPLVDHLPAKWRERYAALESKFGPPRHPAHPVVRGGAFAMSSKSPQQEADLEKMGVDEVVAYANSWRPSSDVAGPFGPSEEGLATVLASLIGKKGAEFSGHASDFVGMEPTYVRAAIQGFETAVRQDAQISWVQVLNLCSWIVSQPIEIPGRTGDLWTKDPDWRWARQAIIGLIDEGFKHKVIPFELRNALWPILEALAEGDTFGDIDYSEEDSQKRDIWSSSINRARPRSVRSVVKYIEWVRDHLKEKDFSFNRTPEAAALLERHLDPAVDPSLDVRLIYGEFLPFLLSVDSRWVEQRLNSILPADQELKSLRDIAWGAYLVANPAYDIAFAALRSFYHLAVEQIGSERLTGRGHLLDDLDENLATHLMQLYWRGQLPLQEAGILYRFYTRATDDLIAQATAHVGRSITESKEQVPAEVLDRLQQLWDWRLRNVADHQHPKEMAAFGWWFNSGYFEDVWALKHLKESLERSQGAMEPKLGTLRRLASLVEKYPDMVISCTDLIVRAEPIDVILWVDDLRQILTTVISVGSQEASAKARSLIHSLGLRGYHEYRELLQQ